MKIRNFTPHAISVWNANTSDWEIFQSEGVARVSAACELVEFDEGINFVRQTFGDVTGLPEEEQDTMLIVSAMVAQASNRKDLCYPTEFVRDSEGKIAGAKALAVK